MSSISIPATDVELTLEQLVDVSLKKNYPPSAFGKLFREFKHRVAANSEEEVDLHCLLTNCAQSPQKLRYVHEILVESDFTGAVDGLTSLFGHYMSRIGEKDELSILIWLSQISSKVPWKQAVESPEFVTQLTAFVRASMQPETSPKKALMIAKLMVQVLKSSAVPDNACTSLVQQYLEYLEKHHDTAYRYLNSFFQSYNLSTMQKDYAMPTQEQTGRVSRNIIKVSRLKKIVWLAHQVTVAYSPVSEAFLQGFKSLLNLSSVATSTTNVSIAFELAVSLFDGLTLSTYRTQHIWEHFIVSKLPEVFKLLTISQQNLRDTLTNAFETIKNYDELKQKLMTTLAECELVADMGAVPSAQDELSRFQAVFEDANPEFVPLEESGACELVGSVDTLAGERRLAQLVADAIARFVQEDDHARLKRLLVALTSVPHVLDGVVLHKNPYSFVRPLVTYLDASIGRGFGQDAMDVDGDSSNLQDTHANLGALLLFVAYCSFRYSLDLKREHAGSEAVRIMADWDPLLDTALMEQLQDPQSSINAVMSDWVASLFDTNNTDGVSDELLKKSASVREYYVAIPCVVGQAVRACQLGMIGFDDLVSGLEYCHQPFLLPTLLNVLRHVTALTWTEASLEGSVFGQVLEKLVGAELVGELRVLHSMVLEMANDDLFECGVRSSAVRPPAPATKLEALIAFVIDSDASQTFELSDVYKSAAGQQLDFFYRELGRLLREQTQYQPSLFEPLSYELVATLMINYASWCAPETLQKWMAASADPAAMYNRTGRVKVKVEESLADDEMNDSIGSNDKLGDMTFDANLFGFIEEAKLDDPEQQEQPERQGPDLFQANLAAIATESSTLVATVLKNLAVRYTHDRE
ncbi:hypothetical protein KL930_002788 [Ogataea haglerorum]|nr:hypothetical protein KL950_004986 [Ogataea haglerorum]KAG7777114.1 hypothetical protein KL930_002788 [Ogataea haglerorum]KAG7778701.1 hypothetical protein KL922_001872 [Ogataea haglerorum]